MTEYVELRARSYFSLLNGASSPESLVARAAELGMPALALVDTNNVYGSVFFVEAAQAQGFKPLLGTSLTLDTGHELTVLAQNDTGWANMCWLITQAQQNAPKGDACLKAKLLPGHTDGLIALSGGPEGAVVSALARKDFAAAKAAACQLVDLFGKERSWIELQHHAVEGDSRMLRRLVKLSKQLGIGYVATNDVHYVRPDGWRLRDTQASIRHKVPLADEDGDHLHHANEQYYLKSGQEMSKFFAHLPDALSNTLLIAEQCNFELKLGLQDFPDVDLPAGMTAHDYLRQLCYSGLRQRLEDIPSAYIKQLELELGVIQRAHLDNYLLIARDFHAWAKSQDIRGQVRGSAANSLAVYALGLSSIDPVEHELVFERFLSDERPYVPDLDIDYQNDRRDEVFDYIVEKYGVDHVARVANYNTLRRRSAIRDTGKALGLPGAVLDRLSDTIDYFDENTADFGGLVAPEIGAQLQDLSGQIAHLPRHLGLHSSGVVVMKAPLTQRLPTEPTRRPGYSVVQADKDVLARAGIVKFDVLSLGILTAIAKALDVIEATTGERPDLDRLSFDDPAIYEMITSGDTVTLFQVDSRAQTQAEGKLKPSEFKDLKIGIAIIRPGPIQGNMTAPYMLRRMGLEAATPIHPLLAESLTKTLGIVIFQEDVLRVAETVAGFSPGQGELLRRALGSKNADTEIAKFHDDFLVGAHKKGVEQEKAEEIFGLLTAFGGYSFTEAHAASFAVLVYQSAWLKYYYPLAAYLGNLNAQPLGFWNAGVVVNDIKRHGITVLGPDVNVSDYDCTLEGKAIRIGFRYVKDFGEETGNRIVEARKQGKFSGLEDFCKRTQLPRRLIQNLILVGACEQWGSDRRQLLWKLGTIAYDPNMLALKFEEEILDIPKMGYLEMRGIEFELLGMTLHEHPLEIYRSYLASKGVLSSAQLLNVPEKRMVRVAGVNQVHQAPPTAKGFHFLTLEDETQQGFINVIIRPTIYHRYQRTVRENPILIVEGQVEREGDVTNVLAERVSAMSPLIAAGVRTRRFH